MCLRDGHASRDRDRVARRAAVVVAVPPSGRAVHARRANEAADIHVQSLRPRARESGVKAMGIPARHIGICRHCQAPYAAFPSVLRRRPKGGFCSKACRLAAGTQERACQVCGATFACNASSAKRSCSRRCAQAASRPELRRYVEDRIAKDGAAGCWNWTGNISTKSGYGRVSHGTKQYAHRVAYELFVGPIPAGLTIDHLCFNHRCVNPAHLEPVSFAENTRRYQQFLKHGGPDAVRTQSGPKVQPKSPQPGATNGHFITT